MTVEISVIIPVYRDWDRLASCLSALEEQSLPRGQFEILVVNNEPEERTVETRLPANARLLHEPSPGSYVARNTAVQASSGLHLAFTDSDCIPDKDWLKNGLEALLAQPDVRITGPVSIFREPGAAHYAYVYDRHTAFPQRDYVAGGHCATANLLVSRQIFDRVGPFERCFSGGDTRWGRRAQEMGVPIVYREEVRVQHPARRGLSEIFRKRRRTAGSSGLTVPAPEFLLKRIKPPVGWIRRLRRERVGWGEALMVFAIHYAGRLVEAKEFSLVRLGLKAPNRS